MVILPARQGYLEKEGSRGPPFFLMSDDPSIAPDDGRIIQSLLQALETFLKLRGPIPLSGVGHFSTHRPGRR